MTGLPFPNSCTVASSLHLCHCTDNASTACFGTKMRTAWAARRGRAFDDEREVDMYTSSTQ